MELMLAQICAFCSVKMVGYLTNSFSLCLLFASIILSWDWDTGSCMNGLILFISHRNYARTQYSSGLYALLECF